MKTRYSNSLSEAYQQIRESAGLADKSKKSGISVGILKKVYDRGLAAYKTGHRPGTTAPQWAMARVNSFITKGSGTWGGADKDLAKQAKGKSEEVEEDFFDPITEACWDGYKQVGMKNKGGKEVPNCVPESVSEWVQVGLDEYYEIGTDEYKEYLKKLTPGEVEEHSNAKPHHHPHREDDDDKKEKGELATTDEARQLKDKKKEMMVKSKTSGVIVIDKKDFKKYQKKGYFAVEEVERAFQSLSLEENYRVLARKGMGAESPKLAKYGQEVDYYEPKRGDKHQGKITRVSGTGYEITDDKTGKKFKFKFYDPKKAKKLMQTESAASDARRAMKKDPDMKQRAFSKDVSATDDDEKAASKNIIMQMRKAVSLKGRFDVEFQDGKKVKIPAKIAQEVQRKFSSLRRPQEKQKFQAKVAKSHKSMLAALRESFDSSPRKLVEGTWSLPDTPSKKNEFKKLMKKKIKLGHEGDDASKALGGLVGDDSLMDDLYAAGKKNPNDDARPIIKKHMKRLGIKEDLDEAKERQISHDEFMKKGGYKNNSQFSTGAGKYKKYYTHAKEEVELDEGYEGEVVKVLKKAKIASYFSNGFLYVERGDGKSAIAALKRAPNIKELPKVREEKPRREELEIDEAKFGDKDELAKKGAKISRVQSILKGKQKVYKKDHKKEELDEMFDYVLIDKDNKIAGRYSGSNAKKEAESGKKSAHLPPMRIPKNEVGKMKIVPINPKDKKSIGDTVLAIGEEVELEEGRMKELHSLIQQGKSAKEIAKTMKLDVKTIKALMNSYIPEGEEEDRVKQKYKDDAEKSKSRREDDIERAKIADLRTAMQDKKREKERNQRNEVLDRVASKLKERKNG